MGLHECLGNCAMMHGIGGASYALCSSKCYAQYPEDRVPADSSKVSFWTSESWEKVSFDLYKYITENVVALKTSFNCADAARDAFNSTGWERSHKVSDVADTVYNIVSAKWLCGEGVALAAKDWVNQNLNAKLKKYRVSKEEPDPIDVPGSGYDVPFEPKPIPPPIPPIPPIPWPSPKPKPDPDPSQPGDCPRGRQYQAPLIGGCDPGYYREKSWGRDLCICEEGPSAETWLDKLGKYLSGNLKMILIVIVVIVMGLVVMRIASKKVSVG